MCLDEASAEGLRVLSARPSDAEARLVFGAGTSEGPVAIPATWLETVATRAVALAEV